MGIQAEVEEKQDRPRYAAGVAAGFSAKDLVDQQQDDPAEEIFQINRPEGRGGGKNQAGDAAQKVPGYGENHGQGPLAAAALLPEPRKIPLQRVGQKGEHGQEQQGGAPLPGA